MVENRPFPTGRQEAFFKNLCHNIEVCVRCNHLRRQRNVFKRLLNASRSSRTRPVEKRRSGDGPRKTQSGRRCAWRDGGPGIGRLGPLLPKRTIKTIAEFALWMECGLERRGPSRPIPGPPSAMRSDVRFGLAQARSPDLRFSTGPRFLRISTRSKRFKTLRLAPEVVAARRLRCCDINF